MAAMEASMQAASCTGSFMLPNNTIDTGGCAKVYSDRLTLQNMDGKDEATCPDECTFEDNAMTPEQAMAMFVVAACGCLVFYSAWMLVRCCVFSKHRREGKRAEIRAEMAAKKKREGAGTLSRKNVRSM
jgi:hypothetical protein